jgi:hypothetical protein
MTPLDSARAVRDALPPRGLFHEKHWRIATRPFPLPEGFADELAKLGHRLSLFLRACDLLYRLSVRGRQPSWIADLLDAGKPSSLVAHQRRHGGTALPRILRPDLVLAPDGYTITEIDNVPGGIGLTAWLQKTYASLGFKTLGGPDGMLRGFEKILPGGDIIVSEESATYRPEMEWLAATLQHGHPTARWRVLDTNPRDDWQPRLYRFFELFDLPAIPAADALMQAAADGSISVIPPFKPALEEKLWFALFWLRPLADFWRNELGERVLLALRKAIPYTWLVDPAPLPPHAVLPRLETHSWDEVAALGRNQRHLVLKVSGFSPLAWGSRGVVVGSDLSTPRWREELTAALAAFPSQPRILQAFHQGRVVEEDFLEPDGTTLHTMRGRVRLCPWFFLDGERPQPAGALATICPDDKKLLHGMRDAIIAPA